MIKVSKVNALIEASEPNTGGIRHIYIGGVFHRTVLEEVFQRILCKEAYFVDPESRSLTVPGKHFILTPSEALEPKPPTTEILVQILKLRHSMQNLDFMQAVKAMEQGLFVFRQAYAESTEVIPVTYIEDDEFYVELPDGPAMWVASPDDVRATDWTVRQDKPTLRLV